MMPPTQSMVEEWRPIAEVPRYSVSSLGRVKGPRRILAPASVKGYEFVTLWNGFKKLNRRIHVLVCIAFHGDRPTPQHQAAHWNGVRNDNRNDNLRWATGVENQSDRRRHGTAIFGSAVANAVLREDQIPIIRQRLRRETGVAIAQSFGVSPSTISMINLGKIWRDVA